jgi:hypothetical protein
MYCLYHAHAVRTVTELIGNLFKPPEPQELTTRHNYGCKSTVQTVAGEKCEGVGGFVCVPIDEVRS